MFSSPVTTSFRIRKAFSRFHAVLKPGGTYIISVRDYAAIEQGGVRMVPFGVQQRGSDRVFVFQVWEWEGDQYQQVAW